MRRWGFLPDAIGGISPTNVACPMIYATPTANRVNEAERKRVDDTFHNDLVTQAGMKKWMAHAFFAGVRVGGTEAFGLSFSWGFARK